MVVVGTAAVVVPDDDPADEHPAASSATDATAAAPNAATLERMTDPPPRRALWPLSHGVPAWLKPDTLGYRLCVTDPADYCGVPPDYVQELGRVVVIAGRTEFAAHLILEALGLDQYRDEFRWKELRRAAATQVTTRGTPDCSKVEPDEVTGWYDAARRAMDQRNVLFHAVHYRRMATAGEWLPQMEHISRRAVRDARTEDAAAVRARLERSYLDGIALHTRLIHGGQVIYYVQRDAADDRPFQLARENYPSAQWLGHVGARPAGAHRCTG